MFDGSRTADETAGKPSPLMLHELMREFGVAPERTLMIGDTTHDLQMAVNAGCASVGVSYGAHEPDAFHVLEAAAHRAFGARAARLARCPRLSRFLEPPTPETHRLHCKIMDAQPDDPLIPLVQQPRSGRTAAWPSAFDVVYGGQTMPGLRHPLPGSGPRLSQPLHPCRDGDGLAAPTIFLTTAAAGCCALRHGAHLRARPPAQCKGGPCKGGLIKIGLLRTRRRRALAVTIPAQTRDPSERLKRPSTP